MDMVEIKIVEATVNTEVPMEDINRLLRQLSSSEVNFGEREYQALVTSEASKLFLMYVGRELAGMVTVASYLCPTGKKYWIEDVVVDSGFRGQGLGRKLVAHAVSYVQRQGRSSLMLTSRPSRIEANKLYQSLGFEKRETNVYRIKIK